MPIVFFRWFTSQSKEFEVVDPYKQHLALCNNAQTMYIFATGLSPYIQILFEVKEFEEIVYISKYPLNRCSNRAHSGILVEVSTLEATVGELSADTLGHHRYIKFDHLY